MATITGQCWIAHRRAALLVQGVVTATRRSTGTKMANLTLAGLSGPALLRSWLVWLVAVQARGSVALLANLGGRLGSMVASIDGLELACAPMVCLCGRVRARARAQVVLASTAATTARKARYGTANVSSQPLLGSNGNPYHAAISENTWNRP